MFYFLLRTNWKSEEQFSTLHGLDVKPACSFAKSKNAREVKRKSWDEGEKIKGVLD